MLKNRSARAMAVAFIFLTGCASGPRKNLAHVPDWEAPSSLAKAAPVPAVSQPLPAAGTRPTTSEAPHPEQWVSLSAWCRQHAFPKPLRAASKSLPDPEYSIVTTNGSFAFHIGDVTCSWAGYELLLGIAPVLIDNEPFMDAVDVRKTLEPLMLVAPLAFSNTPTIVVDPGHGGENAGTRSADGDHFEKEFTLDWALRLKPLLESNGWRVFLTRTNDADLSLSNRVAFAEARHADMFVSLHFNSAGGGQTQAGLETYCLTPAGLPSNLTRGYADDPAMVFPNNAFDAANVRLAFEIHRALLEMNGHRDRGIRRARFLGVLRNQKRPAILIEGGYLSNPEEAEQIADPDYRQRLAEAVAQALGGMLPAEGKPDRVQEGNSQSAGEGASEAAETQ